MKQALAGVRVLEFTQVMAGPFCAMLLGDLGADIIKVEPPGGDTTRRMGQRQGMESAGYWAVNRNKRGIVLNLKDRRAQDIARTLGRQADVVVENYRPGVMAGFGLDYDRLKQERPGLIYASVSGFGSTGPYARKGGFDLVAQGMSGIMSVTGEDGRPPSQMRDSRDRPWGRALCRTSHSCRVYSSPQNWRGSIYRYVAAGSRGRPVGLGIDPIFLDRGHPRAYGLGPSDVGSVSSHPLRRRLYQSGRGQYPDLGEVCPRHRAPRTAGPARIRRRRSPRPKPSSTDTRDRSRHNAAATRVLALRA